MYHPRLHTKHSYICQFVDEVVGGSTSLFDAAIITRHIIVGRQSTGPVPGQVCARTDLGLAILPICSMVKCSKQLEALGRKSWKQGKRWLDVVTGKYSRVRNKIHKKK